MVYDRVSLLRSGREMIAEVLPVDPRDLFRGDYVIFGYSFNSRAVDLPRRRPPRRSRLRDAEAEGARPMGGREGGRAYPATVEAGNFVLQALVENAYPLTSPRHGESSGNVRYGIESYFVPEGTGKELEKLVRDKKLAAVIAVGAIGKAAIKALMIDGQRVVEEPLL